MKSSGWKPETVKLTSCSAREDICRDVAKLMELHKEKEALEEQLSALYEAWESLAAEEV